VLVALKAAGDGVAGGATSGNSYSGGLGSSSNERGEAERGSQ